MRYLNGCEELYERAHALSAPNYFRCASVSNKWCGTSIVQKAERRAKDCCRPVCLVPLTFNCFWHFMGADNVVANTTGTQFANVHIHLAKLFCVGCAFMWCFTLISPLRNPIERNTFFKFILYVCKRVGLFGQAENCVNFEGHKHRNHSCRSMGDGLLAL